MTAAAASRLVTLTITTYAELRQLARLLPKLLLSARQLPPGCPPPRLTSEQEALLADRLARLPQPHLPDVWKTLLYHLTEDGLAAMKRGDEPTGECRARPTVHPARLDLVPGCCHCWTH